jgi:hypothetical protein
VAQGFPARLRPRIFLTFGTTRVVGHQPYAPAVFTPGEIPSTRFQGLSRPPGTWFRRGEPQKKSPVTPPGIDPGTARLVAQFLNHYATPGPSRKLRFPDFMITAQDGVKVVSLTHRPPLPPGNTPGTHLCQRLSRPPGTWFRRGKPQKKSPVTPLGIDPGTARLVAQFLNHYATRAPLLCP